MIVIIILGLFLLSGCAKQKGEVGLANPASLFCEKNNGVVSIITDPDGSQRGECTLKDGTKCDEWKYFKGECPLDYTVTEVLEKSCTKDSECVTPNDYLIRSSCPYTSKCLESKCTVVCPIFDGTKYPDVRECDTCPQLSPPSPTFCEGGQIIQGEVDKCGCQGPPKCIAGPDVLTQELCESAKGHWDECGSACRGADIGEPCTMQCIQYCECGGIAGFGCPQGYGCTDLLPAGANDAMGICTPVRS